MSVLGDTGFGRHGMVVVYLLDQPPHETENRRIAFRTDVRVDLVF